MANLSAAEERHLALVVSPHDEDHRDLIRILRPAGWSVDSASTCREAIRSLEMETARVVIVERDLPDGTWKTLLNQLIRMACPPKVIVTSRMADERLWSEVLQFGGFDVLAQPFYAREVLRTVNSGSIRWYDEWRKASQELSAGTCGASA
ncbi:MAG TPA: response regulator [Bryobacteraceae bacterium]|nr:response regulator [Bryobacteraceae bacterium]